jgi:hypothetical protein
MWLSPRGRELSQRWITHQVNYDEFLKIPVRLLLYELLRQQGLPAGASSAADDQVWILVYDMIDRLADGRLTRLQATQLFMATKGVTGPLGWAGVSPSLPTDIRGAFAFILGYRALRANRPDAAEFLAASLVDLPNDSPLRPLAQAAITQADAAAATQPTARRSLWQLAPAPAKP